MARVHDSDTSLPAIYEEGLDPPRDHVRATRSSPQRPRTPPKPDFGLDSPGGLLASQVTAPFYLYASLRGKHLVWERLLAQTEDRFFRAPALDVGCGRGAVLVKIAQRKRRLWEEGDTGVGDPTSTTVFAARPAPAYAIDVFSSRDQTGNTPEATYRNVAAAGVLDYVVLHTASFTQRFPFADGAFSLVTSSLAIHNVSKPEQAAAVREIARVCAPGGKVIVVDILGVGKEHAALLKEMGWDDVRVSGAGVKMLFGVLPCQILTAVKPEAM